MFCGKFDFYKYARNNAKKIPVPLIHLTAEIDAY